jgi:serine/threonine-protein kinase
VTDLALSALADGLRDRYTIERELGSGGMATVWLARDLRHERPVALKVLRPELSAVLGGERFLREIRLTANLQHPHILPLLDSGDAGGLLYYVMPYVEGESLRQRLQREGQLPLDEALRLTHEVAEALHYAHQQAIIHRDIKPENILLSRGHALVADFGIALAVTQAGGGRLTETGLSLGTPAYMSPEQAMAEPRLDGRSDQYSLACVLYEMLAGEPPYTGPTAQAIIAKRLSEPVPHLGTLRQVPPAVEAAVTRALSKSPADRFPSVAEFAAAAARGLATAAARAPVSRRRLWVVAGITVVAAAVVTLAQLIGRTRTGASSGTTHRQVSFTGRAATPALSPDSRWLAYTEDGSLLVQDLKSQGTPVAVVTAPRIASVRWSRDGAGLFYLAVDSAGWALHVVPRQGGAPRRLALSSNFDITASGDVIYSSLSADSIIALDPQSGARRRSFSLLPLASSVNSLAISPDARWLAFAGVKGSVTFLGLCRTDGSQARRLVEGVPRDGSLGWSPEGDAIYYLRDLGNGANMSAAGDVMKLHISPTTGEPRGEPSVVLGGAFIREFFLSADGRQLAYTKAPPQQKLWAMTLSGASSHPTVEARELSSGTSIHGTPDISADGRSVVFARNDGGTGNLYVTPFDRYEPRPLVSSPSDEWSPRWSPDGRQVAFAVRDAQSPGILVADVATGQARRITSDGLAPLGVIAWMPNGREIVFPLDLGRHYAIQDVATGRADTMMAPLELLGFHLTVPSPDGRHLAVNTYSVQATPFRGLWAVERSGQPWKRYDVKGLGPLFPLLWTADGWIYVLAAATRELWRIRAEGGPPRRLVALPQPCSFWETALSAEARRLVCTVSHSEPDVWLAEHFDAEEGH